MSQPTPQQLESILQFYDAGRYRDAYEYCRQFAPLETWKGANAQTLAGRLAQNFGATRLGYAIHWLAAREYPTDAEVVYFSALAYWRKFGPFHTWRKYRHIQTTSWSPRSQADWLALQAILLANFRDFSRADELIDRAIQLQPDRAWLQCQRSSLFELEDRHDEALKAAEQALAMRPWYRPAVQTYASHLIQLRRDDEALRFLSEAVTRLQSGDVWAQLSTLQSELKLYDDAWNSLDQAELCWPLLHRDSVHARWLAANRCDLAYYRGEHRQAIDFAKQAKTGFFDRIAERLQVLMDQETKSSQNRIQLPVPFIRQHHMTCAPATLAAIAQFWNSPVSHEELAQRICYDGTLSYDERRWATENGFWVREFRITLEVANALIRRGVPFTLNTVDPGSAHLQAIIGFDEIRGTWLVQDPSARNVAEASAKDLIEHYANVGPRGMILLPEAEKHRVEDLHLPDAELYDLQYEVDRHLAAHRREDALLAVAELTTKHPDHRITLQTQISIARYDGNLASNAAAIRKLIDLYPQDSNLQLMRLSTLQELGHRRERLDILRTICSSEKQGPLFWTRLASELLDDARTTSEAKRYLYKSARYRSADSYTLKLIGNLEWSLLHREEAIEWYRLASCASEKDEDYARVYFSASRYMMQTEEALNWLRERYERFGQQRSLPGRTLSGCLEQLGRDVESLETLDATLRQHPQDGELACYAAMAKSRFHRMEEAHQHLESAFQHCSPNLAWRTKASLAMAEGDLELARTCYQQVLEFDPMEANVWNHLSELDADLEGIEAGTRRLREGVRRFPHSYSLRSHWIQWLRRTNLLEAKSEVQSSLIVHPEDAFLHREAAIIAFVGHDLPLAYQHVQQAITLDPINDYAHSLCGQILEGMHDLAGARAAYRRAIELNIDEDTAAQRLLQSCDRPSQRAEQLQFIYEQLQKQTTFGNGIYSYWGVANGRMDARRLLEHLIELNRQRPDLWQSYSALIQQHLVMNQREEAIEVAQREVEQFPLLPRAWIDLSNVHSACGDVESRLQALERAQSINPFWSEIVVELAEVYADQKKWDESERVLRKAIAADPREPTMLGSLAYCLSETGRKQEALETVARACSHALNYIWGWRRLEEWSMELDHGQTSIDTALQVTKNRPHDARGFLRLADIHASRDAFEPCLQALDASLQLDPRSVEAHELRAHTLARMHQWEDALQACEPTVFGNEQPVSLQMRRADILFRKGLTEDAIQAMRVALQLDADNYSAWHQLADWSEIAENREAYLEASQNLVRLAPHLPTSHGYLAEAWLAGDANRVKGKEHLKIAIELSPKYAFATSRLIDLHLEDGETEEASQILAIGGKHLSHGHFECLQAKILARRDEGIPRDDENPFEVVRYLGEWCEAGPKENGPVLLAADYLRLPQARQAIAYLGERANRNTSDEFLGMVLGRLISRVLDGPALIKFFKKLPTGDLWFACMRQTIRGMPAHRRDFSLVDAFQHRFARQIRSKTATWGALVLTLSDYQVYHEIVAIAKDWRKRNDANPTHMIAVLAAHMECLRLRSSQRICQFALKLPEDANQHLLHLWAGLFALLRGDTQVALQHAREVHVHELSGWYLLANRILVAGLEAMLSLEQDAPTKETVHQMVDYFKLSNFPIETHFRSDRVTKWLLHSLRSRLARRGNWKLQAWMSWGEATWLRISGNLKLS